MSWDIKIWHEGAGEVVRLIVEAGSNVPDGVIADVAGSYWYEEVQQTDWDGNGGLEATADGARQRLQG